MLKNIQKSVCALAVLAATTMPALAAGIDLKVIGTITPAACTPTISGGGTIDYGIIPAASLAQDAYTVLEEKSTDLSITCSAPTKVALKPINGRPGTLAGASENANSIGIPPVKPLHNEGAVGLGADGGVNVGGYQLRFGQLMIDGVSAMTIASVDATSWPVLSSTNVLYRTTNTAQILSFIPSAQSSLRDPVAFTTLSTQIRAQAYINKASELDLSKPIQLDGLTTLEMIYL